ncbi:MULTISPECIES: hypothetical protein [unclassified Streptomyces]|uniref:hypothetical protein n=1 Tax=unclassified Streptomyces TaxID=2593676 RepID=UPI00278BC2D1|nr:MULTISPECIES: hypothetical protein [unclassified Streptomyces]
MAFMRHKTTGFAGAFAYPQATWQALFLRSTDTAVISESGLVEDGNWASVAGGKLRGIGAYQNFNWYSDGVLQLPSDGTAWQTMLFHGDRALQYDWDKGTGTEAAWSQIGNWGTALPVRYRSGLDALLQAPNSADSKWRTYFFKGSRVLTLNWSTGVERECLITEGPEATGAAGWASLPVGFRGDLDHVVALPDASGARRTLLVKGEDGLILNWSSGVEKTGKLSTLFAGLGKLPAKYLTPYRPFSGRYVMDTATTRVELRLDFEGDRALCVASGDVFTKSGDTVTYTNSFRANALRVYLSQTRVQLNQTGGVQFANPSNRTDIQVVIPRVAAGQTAGKADLILAVPAWTEGDQWQLTWEASAFRTVDFETDTMSGTANFVDYDTASADTPPGYRDRRISVSSAFAEAGVEMRVAGTTNVANDSSGEDLRWSEAELHAAMVANFSLQRDVPQWKLWTFVATKYLQDAVGGIMFDQMGSHRQGMAVFYKALEAYGLVGSNVELHTYVHELGHAFNMLHSWQKNLASPPAPLGPENGYGELSWMNYPQNYRSSAGNGSEAFWKAFPFQFSDDELRHLRHGFYRYIVPGGDNWTINAALELSGGEAFSLPVTDESGLRLELGGKQAFGYGEPVMADIKLVRTRGDVTVATDLSPKGERVAFAITDPSGRSRPFRPMTRICSGHHGPEATTRLTAADPAIYDTVYLGFGAEGLYFSEPGRYRIVAVYQAADGSRVVSQPRTVLVRQPVDRTDQQVGELLIGDQQGTLLALLGSDAPQLSAGDNALREVVERFGSHPLAVYARLARGANAGRDFQRVHSGRIEVRRPDIKESVSQLTAAIDASTGDAGLNNMTLNAAMRRLARVHAKEGDLHRADQVLGRMTRVFKDKGVPAQVQKRVQKQAEETRTRIHAKKG